jgi:phosphate transport system substrate-binding protein
MKTVYYFFVRVLILSVCAVTILFVSCNNTGQKSSSETGDTLKGKITLSGAFALYPLAIKWAEEFQKLHPNVIINVSAGGAGKGMTDALSKMVDLGMYSKAVSPEEQAKGAWWIAVAKDAVLPTINAENPVMAELQKKGLTKQKFFDIFISGKIKTWGQAAGTSSQVDLQVFNRSDACGAADMWAKYLNNKKQEDIQGLGVNGDPGVADAVKRNREGIGFNNLGFIYEMQTRKVYPGLAVVPIDLNENGKIDPEENFYESMDSVILAITTGKYPSPPARDLYFVSGGTPTSPLVKAFLVWILTDGQKFVHEAGYVDIRPEQVAAELNKLK